DLRGILGDVVEVPCYHHQGIGVLGEDIVPVAWAEDGTIEAVEVAGHPSARGVQWHPEEGEDLRLFTGLVQHASARRAHA
ncbi:MAG TPA: gamma-glutamyl-gamma-aminobutyrate hydrolase family protein, partial [Euzebya sp.]|nr:gamma-glutamyl-gamma-aminobutyrate hydrolase family protein [Euzebya sp.]